jgi:hypothetical protein
VTDLPAWYSIAMVGYGASMGAALAALWHGLWPYAGPHVYQPNILAFAALCAAVVLVGVHDTFRHLTRQPLDPTLALTEVVVGGLLAFLLTQRFLPFLVACVLLSAIRGQAGTLTRIIVDLYDQATVEAARRARRAFTGCLLGYGLLLSLFLLFSGLDHSAALRQWTTAPIVLVAGVCGLMLVSGTEYEVMRSRFRGGQVTSDASFGVGWWGPVAGLIAGVVVLSALLPPPPSFITLRQVGQVVIAIGEHTVRNTGAQNVGPEQPSTGEQTPPKTAVGKAAKAVREHAGLIIFLTLLATGAVVVAVRTLRYAARLGMDVAQLLAEYARRAVELVRASAALFTGLYAMFVQGLRGDWSGLRRWLRRWWLWLWEVLSGRLWRNIWRQLVIRSAAHPPGEEFAAAAGPRTAAGAAWNLPPGDPRRRVRELYRQLLQAARDAGLGRRPGQTPRAFRRALEAAEPATAEGLELLTGAYEWARFSHHPVTPEHITDASTGWGRVSGILARRREQRAALASRGVPLPEEGPAEPGAPRGRGVTIRREGPRRR